MSNNRHPSMGFYCRQPLGTNLTTWTAPDGRQCVEHTACWRRLRKNSQGIPYASGKSLRGVQA